MLLSELRQKSIFDILEVIYVILEPNGRFSIIKKENYRFVTANDLNITAKPMDLPLVVINDGKLFEEKLNELGLNKDWLMDNLNMYDIDDITKVYLATIDRTNKLYISKKTYD